ncbi:MAG TPA: HAD-IA family hydrolase [Aeromicrobium sp.]|nr:HAD-IA family hydrolase [Aeromicrobium sp.]
MAIKALMVDVDGVLVDGRPGDGRHWQTSLEADLGFTSDTLRTKFFDPHWDDIVLGRAGLIERLTIALPHIAPQVSPAQFLSYWLERDSRVVTPLLTELSSIRSRGIRVYLATNQEHLRAAYLMETLGLAAHVDGMFYSARVGARKPDAEFFTRVQESVGLSGDEMLLIDDSRQNVDAALEAGWQALHWTTDSSPDIVRSWCG